jgi:cytoskeleton protein RodZ
VTDTGILKIRRLQKGISLEDIAASTKLSVRVLEAIECGDFKKLPGGIYNTSYIKQYARAIDFSEVDLLTFYRQTCEPGSAGKQPANGADSHNTDLLFQH